MSRITTKSLFAAAATLAIAMATLSFAATARPRPQQLDPTAAQSVFERLKKLDGSWRSKSTKGWQETQQFRVLARGTAVVSQSSPGAATATESADSPNSPMMTVFHMDGSRLLLTHYCEAGNQPRLVATSIEDGGRTVHFSFLDATNLASPAAGHMHSVVMTFLDDNHFSEQWSWYENGKEQWMESVTNERVASASAKH